VPSLAQVLRDRALKRRSLRQAVERSGTRPAKDKLDDLVVGWPAFARHKREPVLEAVRCRSALVVYMYPCPTVYDPE